MTPAFPVRGRLMNRLLVPRPVILAAALLAGPILGAAPDEEALGKSRGYPIGSMANWFYEESVRVGSFSHQDEIVPHHTLERSAEARPLRRAKVEPEIKYSFGGKSNSFDDYLAHQRTTGLLIIKDGEILVERYQYDRKAADRFVSHSMAKSLTSLAVGFALQEGRIGSLDDKVSKYVAGLAGCAYGETSIRNLLRMASGVKFEEKYDGKDDLARFTGLGAAKGTVAALRAFDEREVPEGTRFHYASAETTTLGVLLRAATGTTVAEYLEERLWKPMGAEADATWSIDAAGMERCAGGFNAILRDYGRLGILLANDGASNGRQILPRDYLLEATDWRRQPPQYDAKRATPIFGYGYQFWLFPTEKRRFALIGVYGQAIYVDPGLKLVLVHTGVAHNASVGKESMGLELRSLWHGLVTHFGEW